MFIALGVNFSYPSFVCFHFFLSGVNGFSTFRVIVFIFGFLAGLIREKKNWVMYELCSASFDDCTLFLFDQEFSRWVLLMVYSSGGVVSIFCSLAIWIVHLASSKGLFKQWLMVQKNQNCRAMFIWKSRLVLETYILLTCIYRHM